MNAVETYDVSRAGEVLQQEIARFRAAITEQAVGRRVDRRRSARQAHPQWPLLITLGDRSYDAPVQGIVHNVSEQGIAICTRRSVPAGSTIFVKLFSREEFCPRVPAVVRHINPTREGYLLGCEFRVAEPDLCERGLELGRRSAQSMVGI
jgi:hypothetical protein